MSTIIIKFMSIIISFIYMNSVECFRSPIVKIENDLKITLVEGTRENDWIGGAYYAFRGIPYVKPPVGVLRFKDPQQLDALPSYMDARYDGHDCPSIMSTNASEDCLILNVYTKQLNPITPLPVLFFIHPGGLYLGSALSSLIGPQYLLTKDMVLVTFNYRLGSLGFLNLGTEEVPGNAGFKDQVFALRWVEKYIAFFGGDAADVTIMGYSAGGQSVSLHLVSPMSRKLFHKAIVMSGVLPPQTILPRGDQRSLAIKQSLILNCTIENDASPKKILECLNKFSGSAIAQTLRSMFVFGKDNPVYLWRPVIENEFGQERFLTEDFYMLMKRGLFQQVPLLVGFTNGEFCTSAADIYQNDDLKKRFNKEFQILAPHILMFEEQDNTIVLSEAISEYYTGLKNPKMWEFDEVCDTFSDALIRFGTHRLGSLAAKYVNVYGYNFVYKGNFSFLNYKAKTARVEHLDDLLYLFKMPYHHFKRDEDDAKIIELYVNFIWDFITKGKISENTLSFPKGHIVINETLEQKNGSNFEKAQFWEGLFP